VTFRIDKYNYRGDCFYFYNLGTRIIPTNVIAATYCAE
jgi:hypothetical protein